MDAEGFLPATKLLNKDGYMEQQRSRPKGAAVLTGLEVVGEVLLLQILFLLFSLPLVTVLPAAVALQRAFRQVILEDKPGATRRFSREFAWAWSRVGLPGALAVILAAAAVFSIFFWLSTPGLLGTVALCIIVPLCGVAAAFYLALLAAAMETDPSTTRRNLWDASLKIVLTKPLPLGACVLALATWGILALRVPTLIPLGSGLVPALLAWLLIRKRVSARTGLSG